MNTDYLETKIKKDIRDGFYPIFVSSTLGTTATTAVDNLEEIGEIAKKYNLWYHIDAAYGGNYLLLPKFQHYNKGISYADSFAFNPVKMFPVLRMSACYYVRNTADLYRAFNSDEYQGSSSLNSLDYRATRLENMLSTYLIIKTVGIENFRELAKRIIAVAKTLETKMRKDQIFDVLFTPSQFGVVCFRLKNKSEEDHSKFLKFVNAEGTVLIAPFQIGLNDNSKMTILRMSITWLYIQAENVEQYYTALKYAYDVCFA